MASTSKDNKIMHSNVYKILTVFNNNKKSIIIIILFAILIRHSVSLFNYSGYNAPIMYGDYEAQRHWSEITINIPYYNWYKNTSDNDLLYWGLDYPPLTAYHSYIIGIIFDKLHPDMVVLKQSRGYESYFSKFLMRSSVLLSDLLFFFSFSYFIFSSNIFNRDKILLSSALAYLLLCPSLILIDHGHFQYNCVCLGLFLFSFYLICYDNMIIISIGSFLYCSSISYKQMSLYYSPVFFFFLLSRCFEVRFNIKQLLILIFTVLTSFVLIFFPFIINGYDTIFSVLIRMFPLARGIFEDKVANFWCTTNILFKWKYFNNHSLALISLIITVIFLIPTCIYSTLIGKNYTSKSKSEIFKLLCLLMTSSSLAFFLFSFQVHEKTILFPLIPLSCLYIYYPCEVFLFGYISLFSLLPLLSYDGLLVPYFSILILYFILFYPMGFNNYYKLSIAISMIITLSYIFLPSHPKYPDIMKYLVAIYSFLHFFTSYLIILFHSWKILRQKKYKKL